MGSQQLMLQTRPSIMHVIDSLAVGGAERMLVDIVNSLDPGKYAASVCVSRSLGSTSRDLHEDIPITNLERTWSYDLLGFTRLADFSARQQVDIFHAHGRSTFSLLAAARHLGFIHQPIILHDHFGSIDVDDRVPLRLRLLGISRVSQYIGVCEKLGDWACKAGIPSGRVTVIENALDFSRLDRAAPLDLHALFNIPQDKKIGILVGNLRSEKGLDLLLDACQHLPASLLPVFLVVGREADPAYVAGCRKRISSLGLDHSFYFTGPQESSLPFIKGADFGILPSRSESGPLVLIEYMACRLPFVAFEVGGIGREVNRVLPQWFAPPTNSALLATRIRELLGSSPSERQGRVNFAWDFAQKQYDIATRIHEFTSVYDRVLAGLP